MVLDVHAFEKDSSRRDTTGGFCGAVVDDDGTHLEQALAEFQRTLLTEDYGVAVVSTLRDNPAAAGAAPAAGKAATRLASPLAQALAEALGGKADANADGTIEVGELGAYVTPRVRSLTSDQPTPTVESRAACHRFRWDQRFLRQRPTHDSLDLRLAGRRGCAAESARAEPPCYAAVWVDGPRSAADEVQDWQRVDTQPALAGRKLFDPKTPLRTLLTRVCRSTIRPGRLSNSSVAIACRVEWLATTMAAAAEQTEDAPPTGLTCWWRRRSISICRALPVARGCA